MILSGNRITPKTGKKPALHAKSVLQNLVGRASMNTCVRIDDVPSFLHPELAAFMHKVDIAAGGDWKPQRVSDVVLSIPSRVNTRCGRCKLLQALTLSDPIYNKEAKAVTFKAACTSSQCKFVSTALLVQPCSPNSNSNGKEFWILPKPETRESVINEDLITGDQASRIKRAYKAALKNFNQNDFSECIAASGRIVEAIGKTVFPNSTNTKNIGPLFYGLESSIGASPDFKELLTPLVKLGKALALGRNTGGHFFLETEPDEDLVSKVLDLTEFLLTYVYVVADQGAEVKRLIDACGPLESDDSEDADEPESLEVATT